MSILHTLTGKSYPRCTSAHFPESTGVLQKCHNFIDLLSHRINTSKIFQAYRWGFYPLRIKKIIILCTIPNYRFEQHLQICLSVNKKPIIHMNLHLIKGNIYMNVCVCVQEI